MIQKQIDGIPFFQFHSLAEYPTINHFITTRFGGRSPAPYDSLNLSYRVGDDPDNIRNHWHALSGVFDVPLHRWIATRQVHGSHIFIAEDLPDSVDLMNPDTWIDSADAMITHLPDVCLVILTADCVPVVFFDPVKQVIGIAHAGWRGTWKEISAKTAIALMDRYHCDAHDIISCIGPAIGPCCYSVRDDVIAQFTKKFGAQLPYLITDKDTHSTYLDLPAANYLQLLQVGISPHHIEICSMCTKHHSDIFFSVRQHSCTGRYATGICLKTTDTESSPVDQFVVQPNLQES